jgi:hypothetical protein
MLEELIKVVVLFQTKIPHARTCKKLCCCFSDQNFIRYADEQALLLAGGLVPGDVRLLARGPQDEALLHRTLGQARRNIIGRR